MPCNLLLACDWNPTEYKLARSSGTITVRLVKSPDPDWPCELNPPLGLGLLEQQRVDQLPALPLGQVDRWGIWMTQMFTHAENAAKVRRSLAHMYTQLQLLALVHCEGRVCCVA